MKVACLALVVSHEDMMQQRYFNMPQFLNERLKRNGAPHMPPTVAVGDAYTDIFRAWSTQVFKRIERVDDRESLTTTFKFYWNVEPNPHKPGEEE